MPGKLARRGINYLVIAITALIFVFPILWTLLDSFKPSKDIYHRPLIVLTTPILEHWQRLFLNRQISKNIINSVIVAGFNSIICVALGTCGAYGLLRLRSSKLEKNTSVWALSNRAVPPVVTIIPIYIATLKLGLLDTHVSLIIMYLSFNLPFSLLLMLGYLRSVPFETEEAALIDGCSPLGALLKIIIPLALPGLVTTGLFCFIYAWNEFLFAFILTSSRAATVPVATSLFITATGTWWGELSALGIVQLLPGLVLSLVFQRNILKGLTLGAIKG